MRSGVHKTKSQPRLQGLGSNVLDVYDPHKRKVKRTPQYKVTTLIILSVEATTAHRNDPQARYSLTNPSQKAAAFSGSASSISSDDKIATTGMTEARSDARATLAAGGKLHNETI